MTPSIDDVIREFDRCNFRHCNDPLPLSDPGLGELSLSYCTAVVEIAEGYKKFKEALEQIAEGEVPFPSEPTKGSDVDRYCVSALMKIAKDALQ